jgi:hypothetical protein
MRYYKLISDGYILSIGTGNGGTGITESEYNEILYVIQSKPSRTETTDYHLREDLTWEEYELPKPEEDENIDPTEIAEALEEIV